jgi:translation initiation factor IF-2
LTDQNANIDANKDAQKQSIKLLNASLQQGSELFSLINNLKEMRRGLDDVIAAERERLNAIEAKRIEELEKIATEERERKKREREEKIKAAAKAAVASGGADKTGNGAETTADGQTVTADEKPAVKTDGTPPAAADGKGNAATPEPVKPVTSGKGDKGGKKGGKDAKDGKTVPVIRERTFDTNATPSYIRGRLTRPEPVSPPPGTRPQYPPRPGALTGTGVRPQYPPRPGAAAGARPTLPGKSDAPASTLTKERKFGPDKKKEHVRPGDEKKAMTKRTLIRKGFVQDSFDEDRSVIRRLKNKKQKDQPLFVPQRIERAVITTENLTVKILSEKIGKTAQEIIKQLMLLGIMTSINSVVDFSTMELVANVLGVELELRLEQTKEEILEAGHDELDDEKDLVKRPPVITVMGHVDHGKTSLLDAIRKTNTVSGEAGGITQHIGAYSVTWKGEKITFLDTPGHEAFAEMRARGARITDIAVLVVAADDGIMPQTVEAINHAKAANVPIIVAINKIDKPGADPVKIRQAMTEYGLIVEEWGGDTITVPVSAKTGEGIDKLLESILLLAEVNNYRANPSRLARGSVIEAKLDKGKGPVANIIVQNGTLRVGDTVVSGVTSGRIRAMTDDKGRAIKEAGPSTPISLLGFTDVPAAGEQVFAVADEKMAKQVVAERTAKIKSEQVVQAPASTTLDDVFNQISASRVKDLNVIIKADVQGSAEAIKSSLSRLANDEARVNVVHSGVGAINKSDIMLAEVSGAVIVGFNVRPDAETKALAESGGTQIKLHRVIYEVIDDIEAAMKGLMAPKIRTTVTGRAQVRNVFKITGSGIVAGSYVTNGKILRGGRVRVYRGGEVVFTGVIGGLKRFKDDVKEVAEGYECGISVEGFSDIKELDEIECYVEEEIKA